MDLPGLEEMQVFSTHISSPSFCIYVFVGHGKYDSGCAVRSKGKSMLWKHDNICYMPSYLFHTVCIFYCSCYIRLLRREDVESSVFRLKLVREENNLGRVFSASTVYQFSSVTQSSPTLCDPMDGSTPGLPVHHQLLYLAQTQVHRVGDAIKPSHPMSSPSLPAFILLQHQGQFQ